MRTNVSACALVGALSLALAGVVLADDDPPPLCPRETHPEHELSRTVTLPALAALEEHRWDDLTKILDARWARGRDPGTRHNSLPNALLWHLRWQPLERLDGWCAARPVSHWPHYTRGAKWIDEAWRARGNGFANTVRPEQWEQFHAHLARARTDLERAAQLAPGFAPTFERLIWVAIGLSLSRDEVDGFLRRGVAADPLDVDVYIARLEYMKPKWYGSTEEMFAFARDAERDHPDEPAFSILLVLAHKEVATHVAPDALAYLRRPDVRREIERCYRRYHEAYPRCVSTLRGRSELAEWLGEPSFEWRERAAAEGDEESQRMIGIRLVEGGAPRLDPVAGARWLCRAAYQGDTLAMIALARALVAGNGCRRDDAGAAALLREAAAKNSGEACWMLGAMHLEGKGVGRDIAEGRRLLRRAIELGQARARLTLGMSLIQDPPVEGAEGTAILTDLLRRGDLGACTLVGDLLVRGHILEQDLRGGLDLLRRAARGGQPLARDLLSRTLRQHPELRIEGDP